MGRQEGQDTEIGEEYAVDCYPIHAQIRLEFAGLAGLLKVITAVGNKCSTAVHFRSHSRESYGPEGTSAFAAFASGPSLGCDLLCLGSRYVLCCSGLCAAAILFDIIGLPCRTLSVPPFFAQNTVAERVESEASFPSEKFLKNVVRISLADRPANQFGLQMLYSVFQSVPAEGHVE